MPSRMLSNATMAMLMLVGSMALTADAQVVRREVKSHLHAEAENREQMNTLSDEGKQIDTPTLAEQNKGDTDEEVLVEQGHLTERHLLSKREGNEQARRGVCGDEAADPKPIGMVFSIDHSGSVKGVKGAWEEAKKFAKELGSIILNASVSVEGEAVENGVIFSRWAHPAKPGDLCPGKSGEQWEFTKGDYETCMDGAGASSGSNVNNFEGGTKFVEDSLNKLNPAGEKYTCWVLLMSDCGGNGGECNRGKPWVDRLKEKPQNCLIMGVSFGNVQQSGKDAMKNLATADWYFHVDKILELKAKVLPLLEPHVKECAEQIKAALEVKYSTLTSTTTTTTTTTEGKGVACGLQGRYASMLLGFLAMLRLL